MADHKLTVTARAVDEISGPMKSAAASLAQAAADVAASDNKVALSSKSAEVARRASLSASKQVENAIRLEAASGKPLEQQLIRLQITHDELAVKMRALTKAGQPIPDEMLRTAAAARTSAAELTKASSSAMSAGFKQAPEQFSKVAAGASLVGSATSGMGGAFAQAGNKAAGLLAVVATGGPLGIGIAAITTLVTAGSVVWNTYKLRQEAVEAASRSLNRALAEQAKRVEETSKAAEGAEKRLRDYGKASSEIEQGDLAESINNRTKGLEANRREVEQLTTKIAALNEQYEVEKKKAREAHEAAARGRGGMGATVDMSKLSAVREELDLTKKQLEDLNKARANVERMLEAEQRQLASLDAIAAKEREAAQAEQQRKEQADAAAEAEAQAAKRRADAIRARADAARQAAADEARSVEEKARRIADVESMLEARAKRSDAAVTAYKKEQEERRLATAIRAANDAADAQEKIATASARAQAEKLREIEATAKQTASTMVGAFTDTFRLMRDENLSFGEAFGQVMKGVADGLMKQAATYAAAEVIKRAAKQLTGSIAKSVDDQSTASSVVAASTQAGAEAAAGDAKMAVAASTGAAKGIEAHAGIPFVGIALGLAAAAAIVGAILAARKFAAGGEVTGGVAGQDSVPAMLMPGEFVLSVPVVQTLRKALSMPAQQNQTSFASGGYAAAPSRGRGDVRTVVIRNESVAPVTTADMRRQLLQSRKAMAHLMSRGVFARG